MEPQELDETNQCVEPLSTDSIEKKRERKVVWLPDDLVMEIFCRLPVKSILRFRRVSKAWNSIPLGDYDRKMLPSAMTGLFCLNWFANEPNKHFARTRSYSDSSLVDIDLSFLPPSNTVHMTDVCNGLLLCHLDNLDHPVICNPATRKWSSLPEPEDHYMEVLKLGFDPQLSPHYRLVGFYQPESDSDGEISSYYNMKIFLSEKGKWVDGEFSVRGDVTNNCWQPVYLHGIFHFLDLFDEDTIATIDTEAKVCRRIKLPPYECDAKERYLEHIGSSEGLLHYAKNTTNNCLVWVMKDYASKEWELKHNISYQSILEKLKPLQCFFSPDDLEIRISEDLQLLAFHADLDVIFFAFEGAVLSCHLPTVSLAMFSWPGPEKCDKAFVYSPCYLENLEI